MPLDLAGADSGDASGQTPMLRDAETSQQRTPDGRRIFTFEQLAQMYAARAGLADDFDGYVSFPVYQAVRDDDGELVRDDEGALVVSDPTRTVEVRMVRGRVLQPASPTVRCIDRRRGPRARAPRARAIRRSRSTRGSPSRLSDDPEPPQRDVARSGGRFSLLGGRR
jgi:hypothetical protein